jgi:hypothetical protein
MTLPILAAALLALAPVPVSRAAAIAPARALQSPRLPVGVYVASRYNHRELPAVDRIPTGKGYEHYVKLDECVLTLRPDGRFVVSAKYYHEMVKTGAAMPDRARLSDTYKGSYVMHGGRITLVPDKPSRKQPQPDPIHGTVSGDRVLLAFPIDNGTIHRRFAFDFTRDPNRW